MKTKLFVLLVVFFSSVGIVSAQGEDPCTSQPGCNWVPGNGQTTPPSCVCDELFIDGSGLYIALFAGMILAVYFYKQKVQNIKKA